MENELYSSIVIGNTPSESFNDALFFRRKAQKSKNNFEKYRYERVTLILFCMSAESMIVKLICKNLECKKNDGNINEEQQKILDSLIDSNNNRIYRREYIKKDGKKGYISFSSIYNKLNIFLLNSIDKDEIRTKEDSYDEFKAYIELSSIRNDIVHYSPKNFPEVYRNINKIINKAPNIIKNLFEKYYDLIDNPKYIKCWCGKEDGTRKECLAWYNKDKPWPYNENK